MQNDGTRVKLQVSAADWTKFIIACGYAERDAWKFELKLYYVPLRVACCRKFVLKLNPLLYVERV